MTGAMTTRVAWVDGVHFVAETGSGHRIKMDGAPTSGGRNMGARPMELVLAGLGGCGSFDVVHLLKEAGQDVHSVDICLEADRAPTTPAVFCRIHGVFTVRGRGLDEKIVRQAVHDSATKYSSVSRMLEKSVQITYDCRIDEVS